MAAHILEAKVFASAQFPWHNSDQPGHATASDWKYQAGVIGRETKIDVAIHGYSVRRNVSHKKHLLVNSARKFQLQMLANGAVYTVAAAQKAYPARLFAPPWRNAASSVFASVGETDQLGVPLNLYTQGAELLAQQPLMLVLRKAQDERIRA